MVNPQVGFQPRTTPAERRAFYDLIRRGGTGGATDALHVGPSAPSDPNVELWWDTDETATAGLTQAAADARYAVACQVLRTTNQSIANNAVTVVTFPSDDFDPLGWHDTVSNTERITPTIAGWYHVGGMALFEATVADYSRFFLAIRKSGAEPSPLRRTDIRVGAMTGGSFSVDGGLIQLNGTTDYIDFQVLHTNVAAIAHNVVGALLHCELVSPT